ncbi:MAG: hypothetical protein IJ600_10040 [Lachnospiraceae bacterium]|nr:hypothetical protein [Lachnospiraceae bacterium]
MAVFLQILKIIGIVLLCIIGVLLLILLAVLFVPFRYRIDAAKQDEITGKVKVTWLLHFIVAEIIWQGGLNLRVKILGIPFYDKKRKEEKARRRALKNAKEAKDGQAVSADGAKIKDTEIKDHEIKNAEIKDKDRNADAAEGSSGEPEQEMRETIASEKEASAAEDPGKREAKQKNGHKKTDVADRLLLQFERFADFLERAPEKLADWLDVLPDKLDELYGTYLYYDRLLHSESTEWVLAFAKKHAGALLKHPLPRRVDMTLDYADEDPANVAKIYQYQVYALPVTDRIPGKIDILAQQGEKDIRFTAKIKGRVFLFYLAWHAACLLLNKKVKVFWKRLKREEAAA